MPRRAAAALLLLALACGRNAAPIGSEDAGATAAMAVPEAGGEDARVLGAFLDGHWQRPVPPQGEPPAGWSEGEASLDPVSCGGCHPKQYGEWRTSLHAGAFSPGFAGQLIEGALSAPAEIRSCQTCHAPLAEQQPATAEGVPSSHYEPALRAQGLVCAGCHVRAHRRYGPPRRPGAEPAPQPLPHGGFEVRSEFQQSRFCAPCHQFFDDPGVNGKPLENTFAEWRASPHAAEGRTCQSCHMPDRAHLWRGIHDPETVRAAVDVAIEIGAPEAGRVEAGLRLTARGVGHQFPTYVTPRVYVDLWQEDGDGAELPGTRRRHVIGREIDFARWTEVFDTRVPSGGTRRVAYAEVRAPGARSLVGRVTVDPDFHYRGVFAPLLPKLSDPEARARIALALRRASESSYVLAEVRHLLP